MTERQEYQYAFRTGGRFWKTSSFLVLMYEMVAATTHVDRVAWISFRIRHILFFAVFLPASHEI